MTAKRTGVFEDLPPPGMPFIHRMGSLSSSIIQLIKTWSCKIHLQVPRSRRRDTRYRSSSGREEPPGSSHESTPRIWISRASLSLISNSSILWVRQLRDSTISIALASWSTRSLCLARLSRMLLKRP